MVIKLERLGLGDRSGSGDRVLGLGGGGKLQCDHTFLCVELAYFRYHARTEEPIVTGNTLRIRPNLVRGLSGLKSHRESQLSFRGFFLRQTFQKINM